MAADYDAINLSQGYPDFDCPDRLKELVAKHLYDRKNQYPPMAGILQLREQIAAKVKSYYGHVADPETEITVTSGATEALFDAVHATVTVGDEVIVFDPAYDCYEPAIQLAGARAIHIPLSVPDYSIDWERVRTAINEKTKLIIVNTPHKPCGSILTRSDLDNLAEVTRERNILVLSDEVYEHMVYDGLKHESVLSHDELKQKSFAVFSFGKTFHATGWKLAYCVASKEITTEFRKIHQFVTFTSASFIQYAIADFMVECPEHALDLPEFYEEKRNTFCRLIENSRLKFKPSKGTYFQLVDYSEISDKSDVDFANFITQERGVAAIPLTPFCETPPTTKIVRFCFCKDDSTLEQAAALLRDL